MRYADGPSVECDVRIDANAQCVWELVTDIALPTRFSPELAHVRWLDGATGPVLGARFEGRNRNALLGEWRTVSQVIELAAPRAFAWAVVDPDGRFGDGAADPENPLATWRFDLTNEGNRVRLRHGVRIGPAPSGLSLVIERMPDKEEAVIEYRLADLRTGMQRTLRGIKDLAETRGRGAHVPWSAAEPG